MILALKVQKVKRVIRGLKVFKVSKDQRVIKVTLVRKVMLLLTRILLQLNSRP